MRDVEQLMTKVRGQIAYQAFTRAPLDLDEAAAPIPPVTFSRRETARLLEPIIKQSERIDPRPRPLDSTPVPPVEMPSTVQAPSAAVLDLGRPLRSATLDLSAYRPAPQQRPVEPVTLEAIWRRLAEARPANAAA